MPELSQQEPAGVSILAFGARGDGKFLNSNAVQAAVDYCSAKGGGTVLVPEGVYLCGTVSLRSNVTLRLLPGAVLKASGNLAHYRPNGYVHNLFGRTLSFLYAIGQSDVRIAGDGEIDLNDAAFLRYETVRGFYLPAEGLSDVQRMETAAEPVERPTQPIFFHDCRRVRVDGVTIRNAPCWTLTFSVCRDVRVTGVTIHNNLRTPDSDGVHISASKDVILSGCRISTGGDAVAVTSVTNPNYIAERVILSDCILRSRSAALRLGQGASKVRGVIAGRIYVSDSNRGVGIYAADDGFVEEVTLSDFQLETQIFLGAWAGYGEPLYICAEGGGSVQGIAASRFRCSAESGVALQGAGRNVRDIALADWSVRLRRTRHYDLVGNRVCLPRHFATQLAAEKLPWLFAEEVDSLALRGVRVSAMSGGPGRLATEPLLRNVSQAE